VDGGASKGESELGSVVDSGHCNQCIGD